MSDIFISYDKDDFKAASKLVDALKHQNMSVWWDSKIRAGDDFDVVIEEAVEQAKCVIVLWSQAAIKSRYVKAEAALALKHKKLVPVKIDAVDPPMIFQRVQTVDLSDRDFRYEASEFRKLVDDVAHILDPSPSSSQKQEAMETGDDNADITTFEQIGPEAMSVLLALGNPKYKRGRRTVGGLAEELRVSRDEVQKYLLQLRAAGFSEKNEKNWTITLGGQTVLSKGKR